MLRVLIYIAFHKSMVNAFLGCACNEVLQADLQHSHISPFRSAPTQNEIIKSSIPIERRKYREKKKIDFQVLRRDYKFQQVRHLQLTLYFSLDVSRCILHHSRSTMETQHSTENGTSSKDHKWWMRTILHLRNLQHLQPTGQILLMINRPLHHCKSWAWPHITLGKDISIKMLDQQ